MHSVSYTTIATNTPTAITTSTPAPNIAAAPEFSGGGGVTVGFLEVTVPFVVIDGPPVPVMILGMVSVGASVVMVSVGVSVGKSSVTIVSVGVSVGKSSVVIGVEGAGGSVTMVGVSVGAGGVMTWRHSSTEKPSGQHCIVSWKQNVSSIQ